MEYILKEIHYEKDMMGKKVLVTAGATREAIDPVRYITNYSTGKMGYAIAKMAMRRGADVTLISGVTNLEPPIHTRVIPVKSAEDMFQAVKAEAEAHDIIVKAAAVADYTMKTVSGQKIKKKGDGLTLELKRTTDILEWLGQHRREGQFLCGFSMETEKTIENSREKLEKKKVDMMIANNLNDEGAGFGVDTNIVTLITEGGMIELPIMTKEEVASAILDAINNAN